MNTEEVKPGMRVRLRAHERIVAGAPPLGTTGTIVEGVRLMTALTEELAYVRTMLEASEAECRRREEQDLVWRTKYPILENELAELISECVKQISLRILADIEVRLLRGPSQASVRRGGPSMKPHVFAKMVNEVRDLAKQYGHTEQFRCRVADLLKEYITVEHGKGIHGANR